MIYYKIINSMGEILFCSNTEDHLYFFVLNDFLMKISYGIHNNKFLETNIPYYSRNIDAINSTINAINNKEYESAYFFCKDYMGFHIEAEEIDISVPIVTPEITKAVNYLNKEIIFK